MEHHDNENVVLELDNQRFEVNKKKLINKSQYFTAYFSTQFIEYNLSEHKIKYEIPETSFQDFINWINSDEPNVIIDAENMNVERLLTLVNLSAIYQVKDEFKLTETIIDILQNRNLTFQEIFDAWMMGEQANSEMLRDLYFSVCLDRFTELPLNLICELPKKNFLQLIENTNLRIPKTKMDKGYLSTVAQEWMKVNKDTISLDNLKESEPKVYQSIVFYNRHNYRTNHEFYLYCWDGDNFFKLATFKCPKELINNKIPVTGMQIIARGHNLYLIGGDFSISPKIFNKKVWRYSLITENWYIETTMLCERKEMIAVFVQNKLLLAGGLGPLYRNLKSLDIYDVHKGIWTTGMNMPFKFTYIGAVDYNVVDKYLICFFREDLEYIYLYNSEINSWFKIDIKDEQKLLFHDLYLTASIIKQFKSASCFDVINEDGINLKTIVFNNSEYEQKFCEKNAEFLEVNILNKYKERNFDMYFYFNRSFDIDYYDCYVLLYSEKEKVKCKLIHLKRELLPWCNVPVQNINLFQSLEICSKMFSNVMDPAKL